MAKSVLVIGGNGYIGSRLIHDLQFVYHIDSVDVCWFGKNLVDSFQEDYKNLTKDYLSKFDTVILLAGHSSVKMCNGTIDSSWNNNVLNFINLVEKLDKQQTLIYASSGSLYGVSDKIQTEDDVIKFRPINNYDLTKYSLDLNAHKFINQGYKIIGLRFGTVNGWSPHVREELMINSMTKHSIEHNQLTVNNIQINRPILGISDLTRAVISIIDNPKSGIYNLASFCDNVDNISQTISNITGSKIKYIADTANNYDFNFSVDKFKQTYNFKFQDSTASLVNEIITNVDSTTFGNRNQFKLYE
jgi:nucleoside-diphosphate-sugar epimerase